jgi:hypothetical protein
MVTTNLPHIFPLLKVLFDPLIGTILSTGRSSQKHSDGTPKGFRTFGGGGSSGPSWRGRGPPTANPITDFTANGSEERIIHEIRLQDMKINDEASSGKSIEYRTNIHRSVEVEVVREDRIQAATSLRSDGDQKESSQPWVKIEGEHSAYAQGPKVYDRSRRFS